MNTRQIGKRIENLEVRLNSSTSKGYVDPFDTSPEELEKMIEEYNNISNDIKVKLVFQGLYDDMKTKLINSVKTGDLPDMAQVAIEYLDVFIKDNRIEPITGDISEKDKICLIRIVLVSTADFVNIVILFNDNI